MDWKLVGWEAAGHTVSPDRKPMDVVQLPFSFPFLISPGLSQCPEVHCGPASS